MGKVKLIIFTFSKLRNFVSVKITNIPARRTTAVYGAGYVSGPCLDYDLDANRLQ